MMRKIRPVKFAVSVVAIAPLLVMASEPATQPVSKGPLPTGMSAPDISDPETYVPGMEPSSAGNPASSPAVPRGRFGQAFGEGGMGGPMGRGRMGRPNSKPGDIAETMKYMAEHSPNRFAALNSLPDGERKQRLQELAANNYFYSMRLENTDPQLYQATRKRVETEDEIFGLVTRIRSKPSTRPSTTQEADLKSQLREKVSKLVDLVISERQLRVSRLEATLQDQKKKLADDSANRSGLVEARMNAILMETTNPPLNFENAGHSRGPRQGEGFRQSEGLRPSENHP